MTIKLMPALLRIVVTTTCMLNRCVGYQKQDATRDGDELESCRGPHFFRFLWPIDNIFPPEYSPKGFTGRLTTNL